MIKCAIYVRVSTSYQSDKDSIPMQKQQLIRYSEMIGAQRYEIFEDAGFSGKNTDRPAFQNMMSRLRKGEFSHVLVWKLDRISRNLIDFANMYDEFKHLGVTFISLNEQFDTSTAMGGAMLKIILVFAELERNMTSERVTSVMINKASNGDWNGGKVPFGYNYDKKTKTFSVNAEESKIVETIFTRYAETKSLIGLCKEFNGKSIFTRKGNPWTPTTLQLILRNPFYLGIYRYNVRKDTAGKTATIKDEKDWVFYENHHPAIISKELFDTVGDILTSQQRLAKKRDTRSRKCVHLFAGLLECGNCGATMQASSGRIASDGYVMSKYACSTRRRSHGCSNAFMSDNKIAPFILNYIANIIRAQNSFGKTTSVEAFEKKLLRGTPFKDIIAIEPNGLLEMYALLKSKSFPNAPYDYEKGFFSSSDTAEAQLPYLRQETRKIDAQIAKLVDLYSSTDMSVDLYQKKLSEYQEKKNELEKQIQELSSIETISDDDFLKLASYFVLNNSLLDERFVDFSKLHREIDLLTIKNFVINTIEKIVITDGKISKIHFKNGIVHAFIYSAQNS